MTKPGDPTKTDEHERRLARLEKALGEALARSDAAEAMLEDQRERLKALGAGREETMRALTEVREELKRVSQERDELRKKLARVDSVQTATIALPDDDPGPSPATANVPSLEDLMGALGEIEQPRVVVAGHLHQRVTAPDDSEEMLAPELVFPEKFAETADRGDSGGSGDGDSAERGDQKAAGVSRILVLLDPERPIKYPLYKETMTIGRADVADIQINNGFLSRLHARIVTTPQGVIVEDIESKNGIRVNSKVTPRQTLRHGDIVDFGRLRFRFIDTASDDAD
jgi:hypothetical protein